MKIQVGGSKLTNNIEYLEKWINKQNPGPLVVEVSLSRGCNHNCVHCSYQQYGKYKKRKSFINSEALRKFLYDFKSMGGLEVYFAGNGEPLLNKSLPEFIYYGYNLGLDVTLSTNGALLTKDLVDRIFPYVKWIKFSINGGDRTSYAKIHQCNESDFDKVLATLEYMSGYRIINKLNNKIIIHFILSEHNLSSLPKIVEITKNLNIDLLIIRDPVMDNDLNLNYPKETIKFINKLKNEENIIIKGNSFSGKDLNGEWTKCYGINFHTNLDEKGNLFTCWRNVFYNSIYGNITQNSFLDIWQSPGKKEIFSIVEKGEAIHKCSKWCQSRYDNIFIESYLKNNSPMKK